MTVQETNKTIAEIEELGYVINKDGTIIGKRGLPMKFYVSKNGYYILTITFRSNGMKSHNGKTHYLHRLLAMKFLENPLGLNCVNHIDGNKLNNSLDNLEWCTSSENNTHALRMGLKKHGRLGKTGKLNPRSRAVFKIKDDIIIDEYDSIAAAAKENNIRQNNICEVLSGKNSTSGGFKWAYKSEFLNKQKEINNG